MLDTCKVCGCKELWKAGIINGKQRYRCKNCNKNQGETDARVKYSEDERNHALVLYLEGCGFRKIARIMSKLFDKKYRYQTIMHWIKIAGLKVISEKTKHGKVDILGIDELYTYVNEKYKEREYGLLLIGTKCALLHLK